MANSNKGDRPAKPYDAFPLSVHATGRWCKKIRGKIRYFGTWDDWEAALAEYERKAPFYFAGKEPPSEFDIDDPNVLTIRSLCGEYLLAKKQQLDSKELSQRHFDELKVASNGIIAELGATTAVSSIRPTDFRALKAKLGKGVGPVTQQNAITKIRCIFNWGYKEGLIDRPMQFGTDFGVSAKARREARNTGPKRFIPAAAIRAILEVASPQMRAMVLLGINCALGNRECGQLRRSHFATGWLDYPRPKTGMLRRSPLWVETIDALDAADKRITRPRGYPYFFRTKYGKPWFSDDRDNAVSKEFRKLADKAGVYRPGVAFYSLRHTFRTVADEVGDLPAIHVVMGHADDSTNMDHVYVESIGDDRLKAVSEHVHAWLFKGVDE
jgi:integrase